MLSTKMLASQTIKLRHSVTFTLTPSHLDIVLFLMDIWTFSFALITCVSFLELLLDMSASGSELGWLTTDDGVSTQTSSCTPLNIKVQAQKL